MKTVIVEKEKFDAVLSRLVKSGPVPMKQIKAKKTKKRFPRKQSES